MLPPEAAHVTKLIGRPGAGKTTTLFKSVKDAIAEGYHPEDIRYLNFTRAGSREVEERLQSEQIVEDEDTADSVASTFHSAARAVCVEAGLIGDGAGQIITKNKDYGSARGFDADPFGEFAERHGLRYEPEDASLRDRREGRQVETGANALYNISEWLTLVQRDDIHFMGAPVDAPIPDTKIPELLGAWREFKDNHPAGPLYEHHDYVAKAVELADDGLALDAKVLLIDEFQDLSPVEYLLYKKWRDSDEVEKAVIAGDPDQSIFRFRAASPRFFVETPADEVVRLEKSYRVLSNPAAIARGILEANGTDPEGFRSAKDGSGEVHTAHLDSRGAVANAARRAVDRATTHGWGAGTDVGSDEGARVFLLSRTNRHTESVCRALIDRGVPFLRLKDTRWCNPWEDRDVRNIYRLVRNCRLNAADGIELQIRPEWLEALVRNTPLNHDWAIERIGEALDSDAETPRTITAWQFEGSDSFDRETVRRLLLKETSDAYTSLEDLVEAATFRSNVRQALLNAVDAIGKDGKNGHPPGWVRVGTLHSSKGFEAPSVFLFDGYNKRLYDAYRRDPEQRAEEHRLYYVGATRAMNELTIARDFVGGYTVPIFDGHVPRSRVSASGGDGE